MQDRFGNPLTVEDPAAHAAIDDFVAGFVAYETRAANILRLGETRDCLANAYQAMLWMFLESPAAPARAAPHLARADANADRANERERMVLALARAWAGDELPRALAIGAEINARWPRDLVTLKLRQYLQFGAGDAAGMLKASVDAIEACADIAYAHGMLAFGYEECHRFDEAERAARHALALSPKEPWAQHALAHVMLTQGRIAEGADFLQDARTTWVDLNSFMQTHGFWHLALFYLSQGKIADALALYDEQVWGVDKAYSQDQAGAVALLTRLDLAGADVGPRWADLAPHLAVRREDVVSPFLSLHYLYGLARAENAEAHALHAAIARHAATAPHFARDAWTRAATFAADGLVAHARSDHALAAEALGAALPQLWRIGGSHAQRDLFELIWIDALIRAGHLGEAQQALERRAAFDPEGAVRNEALAQVYHRLDLPALSAAARARAAATKQRFS